MAKVLVVDQNPHNRMLMSVGLAGVPASVLGATNAEEALHVIEDEGVDLIITETDLGESSGFDFVKYIKSDVRHADIPVLFLTRDTDIDSKISGLEIGAEEYLTKPIYLREFATRVRSHLKKQEEARTGLQGLRAEYSGELSEGLVADILQAAIDTSRTGWIEIDSDDNPGGEIYFASSRLIHAQSGKLRGDMAAIALLRRESGVFTVHFEPIDVIQTIETDPDILFNRAQEPEVLDEPDVLLPQETLAMDEPPVIEPARIERDIRVQPSPDLAPSVQVIAGGGIDWRNVLIGALAGALIVVVLMWIFGSDKTPQPAQQTAQPEKTEKAETAKAAAVPEPKTVEEPTPVAEPEPEPEPIERSAIPEPVVPTPTPKPVAKPVQQPAPRSQPVATPGPPPAIASPAAPPAQPSAKPKPSANDARYNAALVSGKKALGARNLSTAEVAYKQAIKMNAARYEGYLGLGRTYMASGKPATAVEQFKTAVAKNAKAASAWLELGTAYHYLGRMADAKKAYQTYLKLKPKGKSAEQIRALIETL